VLDWEVVGRRAGGEDPGIDVVAVAARRDMLGMAMEAMRQGGLRPVAIDLSAFGMIRALESSTNFAAAVGAAPGESQVSYEERMAQQAAAATPGEPAALGEPTMEDANRPARLFCHLGDILNLAVAQGSSCLFTRISLHGIEGIAQRLSESRELTLEHARQWLNHVGLAAPLDQVAGDPEIVAATREALEEGVVKLAAELRVSLEYYGAQGGATAVEGVVACGPGSAIPGLVERLERELGYRFSVGRPPALAHLDPAAAARLTLSYGLALDE
jgi:type IV pilus assembly protein PilM